MEQVAMRMCDVFEELQVQAVRCTHEFTGHCCTIRVGLFRGQLIAIKNAIDLGHELAIMKHVGFHPHIIQLASNLPEITDLEEDDGDCTIIMEGIPKAMTLDKWIPEESQCPDFPSAIRLAISLMWQLASALAHVHDKRIIHHDVKEENVLVKVNGKEVSLKLCDFGVAERMDEHGHGNPENRDCGSHWTQAPEQTTEESTVPITAKIDVFAYGSLMNSILHTMCSFDVEEHPQRWEIIVERLALDFPQEILLLKQRCKDKNYLSRPDMKEVEITLAVLLAQDPIHWNTKRNYIEKSYVLCEENNNPFPPELLKYVKHVTSKLPISE